MTQTLPQTTADHLPSDHHGAAIGRWRQRRGRGRTVIALSAVVALALVSPLAFLALDASHAGWSEIHDVLFREQSWFLLRHTVILSALVAVLSAVIGVAAALCTERGRLPARRLWTVLLVLPVAMPDFVAGFAWHTIAPNADPLIAATLVMTLGTYPMVYLPVAAALRRADPAMEDTARSLGMGRARTLWRVTLPVVRNAIAGGVVLVVLTVISEYGAFEILRYQTFTTEIFTEFQFEPEAAGALAVPLVLLGLLVLVVDGILPRRTAASVAIRRPLTATRLGWSAVPMTAGLGALAVLGVGVPIGTLVYWMAQSQHTTLPAVATLTTATWTTLRYSALGAAAAVILALPVALLSARRSSVGRIALERSTYVTQALPGVVVALSFVYITTRYVYGLYQTSFLLVAAYALLHFPLALVCVKTSVSQAPALLADVGRSLGRGPVAVFFRITLPLLAPGLVAGFCLVFLTAVTELTATLVLAPIGVETLATQFWAYQSEVAYGAAAPYALVIVAMAMVPGALLGLWFDRDPTARTTTRAAGPIVAAPAPVTASTAPGFVS
jgi:iron(III) transport system permease protein